MHFIGICGKAMGGIAAALAREGWRVSGSDENTYEPMRGLLDGCDIRISSPYHPHNVPGDVDLAIVGKRIASDNPELLDVLRRGIPHRSFPQFLGDRFLTGSRNAIVAGGVGKTTTTAMLAWILEHAGLNPDYLCGGLPRNLQAPVRLAGSGFAVLEGDEYASCFDDRSPKFVHYRPEVAIITNIVEDHPDIYRSFDELCDAFTRLVQLLPSHGRLILDADDQSALRLAEFARCRVITTGSQAAAAEVISDIQLSPGRSCFRLRDTPCEIPLCGMMNVRNAAMALLAAEHFDVEPARAAAALRVFEGVHNRQEEKEVGGCTLVHDKASHPRALMELASALRQRFPGRRLVSVIQPRATGGRDWVYQRELPRALSHYDKVVMTSAYEHNPQQVPAWAEDPFCLDTLASALAERSVAVTITPTLPELSWFITSKAHDGDVLVLTVPEQSTALRDAVETALKARTKAPCTPVFP